MRFEDQRELLAQDLAKLGIKDERVLAAFRKVPREEYVLPEYREYAYRNQPLPLTMSQTISQPLMIAIMLDLLELQPGDHVLEIGTGSGYQSALLAEIVTDVCTVELLESLSLKAQDVLRAQGYKNVHFRIGDGSLGWQKAYPPYTHFDKIIVSAAASSMPDKLREQLSEGGILIAPVGGGSYQVLHKLVRVNDSYTLTEHGACTFVPLVAP